MGKSKLEELTKNLIAHKFVTSVSGSFSTRVKRAYEKLGEKIGKRLKEQEKLPEGSNLILSLEWDDRAVSAARKITLALEEFKQVNEEAYNQFKEILDKHRSVRRAYLKFGGNIENEYFYQVIEDSLKSVQNPKKIYDTLKIMKTGLQGKKKPSTFETYLLSE